MYTFTAKQSLVALFFCGLPIYIAAAPASQHTIRHHNQVLEHLPFADKTDFTDAQKGLIYREPALTIKHEDGRVVWDLSTYKAFITQEKEAPLTVNPSLWRMSQLNLLDGLYQVQDNIYQVRGYDLSNITFIRGQTGWIVFDVGTSKETAAAALDLIKTHIADLPIKAVIYSHPHVDHFAGIKGIVNEQDVLDGKVVIIAPAGFMAHAINEGVITGNVMKRRASYMYGAFLPRDAEHSVGSGLGMTNPLGTLTLISPTLNIQQSREKHTIDGVEMEFQLTPGTEAPVEMNIFLPQLKAMWMAENTTHTMHNILSLRGTQVRDAKLWAYYINETIDLYGPEIEVVFQSHHWPVWENERIDRYLRKQRDLYKFIHDRTVNLMNKGYTGKEIAEKIALPPSLDQFWSGRGYYGTLKHNARAVYQYYMGWYDGNPSSLDALPPEIEAKKYLDYIGRDQLLRKAKADYQQGNYRWVATVVKHAVYADDSDTEAKELLANAYEQLGYQAESGPWRSIYLQGALELRKGAPSIEPPKGTSSDILNAMDPGLIFDFLAVRLNAEKVQDLELGIAFHFTDLATTYTVFIENSVLNHSTKSRHPVSTTLHLNQTTFNDIQSQRLTWKEAIQSGQVKLEGDPKTLLTFGQLFEPFELWFNMVTP